MHQLFSFVFHVYLCKLPDVLLINLDLGKKFPCNNCNDGQLYYVHIALSTLCIMFSLPFTFSLPIWVTIKYHNHIQLYPNEITKYKMRFFNEIKE